MAETAGDKVVDASTSVRRRRPSSLQAARKVDQLIDYAYSIEAQSQPGEESLRRALYMSVLLRDGAGRDKDAAGYIVASHRCSLTEHLRADLALANAGEPPKLNTADIGAEMLVCFAPDDADIIRALQAQSRRNPNTENMLPMLALTVGNDDDAVKFLESTPRVSLELHPHLLARTIIAIDRTRSKPSDADALIAAQLKMLRRFPAAQPPPTDTQRAPTHSQRSKTALILRWVDILIDAALQQDLMSRLQELLELRAIVLSHLPDAKDEQAATTEELARIRQAQPGPSTSLYGTLLEQVANKNWPFAIAARLQLASHALSTTVAQCHTSRAIDLASVHNDKTVFSRVMSSRDALPANDPAWIWIERHAHRSIAGIETLSEITDDRTVLRRAALAAELRHGDKKLAANICKRLSEDNADPVIRSHQLRVAVRSHDVAAAIGHYADWGYASPDAAEAGAAFFGAGLSSLIVNDVEGAQRYFQLSQRQIPNPLAQFGENLALSGNSQASQRVATPLSELTEPPQNIDQMRRLEKLLTDEQQWVRWLDECDRYFDIHLKELPRRREEAELLERASAFALVEAKDPGRAARYLRYLVDAFPKQHKYVDSLLSCLSAAAQWQEYATLCDERAALRGPERGIKFYLAAARCYETRLRNAGLAAERYERVLESASQEEHKQEAVGALSRIYESTAQWGKLLVISEVHAGYLASSVDRAALWFKLGSIFETKYVDQVAAERYYKRALAESPECTPALVGLRELYTTQQNWPEVIATFQLDLENWPDEADQSRIWSHIAQLQWEHVGDENAAYAGYQKAIELDGNHLEAQCALFDIELIRGNIELAQRHLDAIDTDILQSSNGAKVAMYQSRLLVWAAHRGEFDGEFWRQVEALLSTSVDNARILDALIIALDRGVELPSHIVPLLDDVASRTTAAGWHSRYHALYARHAYQHHRLDLCEEHLIAAEAAGQRDEMVLRACVPVWLTLCKFENITRVARTLQKNDSHARGNQSALRLLRSSAQALSLHAQHAAALDLYTDALQLDDKNGEVWIALGAEKLAVEDAESAALCATASLSLLPRKQSESLAHAYTLRAIAHAQLRKNEDPVTPPDVDSKIEQDLRSALQLLPLHVPAVLALCELLDRTDRAKESTNCLLEVASQCVRERHLDRAIILQRRIAQRLIAVGKFPLATDALRGILRIAPQLSDDRVLLAQLYARSDVGACYRELHKQLQQDVFNPPALAALESLYRRTDASVRADRIAHVRALLGLGQAVLEYAPIDRTFTANLGLSPKQANPATLDATVDQHNYAAMLRTIEIELGASIGLPELNEVEHDVADDFAAPILQPLLAQARNFDVSWDNKVPHYILLRGGPTPRLVLDRQLLHARPEVIAAILIAASRAVDLGVASIYFLPQIQQGLVLSRMAARLEADENDLWEWVGRCRQLIHRAVVTRADNLLPLCTLGAILETSDSAALGERPLQGLGRLFCPSETLLFFLSDEHDAQRKIGPSSLP